MFTRQFSNKRYCDARPKIYDIYMSLLSMEWKLWEKTKSTIPGSCLNCCKPLGQIINSLNELLEKLWSVDHCTDYPLKVFVFRMRSLLLDGLANLRQCLMFNLGERFVFRRSTEDVRVATFRMTTHPHLIQSPLLNLEGTFNLQTLNMKSLRNGEGGRLPRYFPSPCPESSVQALRCNSLVWCTCASPLRPVMAYGKLYVTRKLLVAMDDCFNSVRTPIIDALLSDDQQRLEKTRASPLEVSRAIFLAALLKHSHYVNTLLKKEYDPGFVDERKRTPLHAAALAQSHSIVQTLLASGFAAMSHALDSDGDTYHMLLAFQGDFSVVYNQAFHKQFLPLLPNMFGFTYHFLYHNDTLANANQY